MSDPKAVRTCNVPGCTNPCHVCRNGHVRSKCLEHQRQHERERAMRGSGDAEHNRRAALGLLMDHPEGAVISNAHPTPNAFTVAPATAKSLVRAGLAAVDPEHNRVVITETGRQWWLELMRTPPVRTLKSDRDYVASEFEMPERSSLAAAARALPPLPPAPPLKLAEELALLAELKARLRLVDIAALASVPQVAPLMPLLERLERAG